MGFFDLFKRKDKKKKEKYKMGLHKTREGALSTLKDILSKSDQIDEDLFDQLEETFIMADIGVDTVVDFIDKLKEEVSSKGIKNPIDLQSHEITPSKVDSKLSSPITMISSVSSFWLNSVSKSSTKVSTVSEDASLYDVFSFFEYDQTFSVTSFDKSLSSSLVSIVSASCVSSGSFPFVSSFETEQPTAKRRNIIVTASIVFFIFVHPSLLFVDSFLFNLLIQNGHEFGHQ